MTDMNPTNSELGRAGDALDWALDHINDSYERTDFLECWREGDTSVWPEYSKWLAVQQRHGTRKSEALADDAVEQVLAHVAGGGPHEWGYRDPVTGDFIADDWPFRAADALSTLTPSPAVDLLREAREACFRDALAEEKQPDRERKFGLVARIDAALKEAK